MGDAVKVTMLLADAAQTVQGKLYVLGGGWSVTGPGPTSMAIAIKVEVPWDQAGWSHRWRLELVDSDGEPVLVGSEVGERPVEAEAEFMVERPPDLKAGTPLDFSLALSFAGLPLPPGGRYVWRFTIDGRAHEDWQLAFTVRPVPD